MTEPNIAYTLSLFTEVVIVVKAAYDRIGGHS